MTRSKPKFTKKDKALKREIMEAVCQESETKQYLSSAIATNVTNAGVMSASLLQPAQGDAFNERIGDVVNYESVSIRGSLVVASTTNTIRLVLLKWKVDNSVEAPTYASIMDSGSFYINSANAPNADIIFNKAEKEKFTILYDRTWQLDQTRNSVAFHIDRKVKGKCYFNTAALTSSHNLYLLSISDDGVTTYPQITYVSEIKYCDP